MLGTLLGLPIRGPIFGLGWIARRIAEAADREMADPARIEADLLALEGLLEAGEIDEPAFEAREAELLAELAALQRPQGAQDRPETGVENLAAPPATTP